jgi:hypothetical protein
MDLKIIIDFKTLKIIIDFKTLGVNSVVYHMLTIPKTLDSFTHQQLLPPQKILHCGGEGESVLQSLSWDKL